MSITNMSHNLIYHFVVHFVAVLEFSLEMEFVTFYFPEHFKTQMNLSDTSRVECITYSVSSFIQPVVLLHLCRIQLRPHIATLKLQ